MIPKKYLYIFGGSLVVGVLLAAVAGYYVGRSGIKAGGDHSGTSTEGLKPEVSQPSPTREEVPAGTVVPETTSTVSAEVAKPDLVISAGPNTASKKRIFDVAVTKNAFTPDTLIVRAGDVAHVNFTADGAYQVVQPDYGFTLNLAKGETKVLEGQFNYPGKFLFYCSSCGGPAAGPRGYIIVTPQDAP